MDRWEISDAARDLSLDESGARRERQPRAGDGNAARERDAASHRERPVSRERNSHPHREQEQRPRLRERERRTSLRQSQLQAMSDIGTFRTVDIKDLAHYAYRGDEARMQGDLQNLRKQGLIEEKTLYRAHQKPRQIVTLTKEGDRLLRRIGDLPHDQESYHGFVKPREQDHDADLYKVYQKAMEEIEKEGGKVRKVRLDFELKASINREKESAGRLPDDLKEKWLEALADEHGLTVQEKKIRIPDLQIEYETADREVARENVELISRNYREEGIRAKAASGFTIYARTGDANRIRRALQDSGMVGKVLSL